MLGWVCAAKGMMSSCSPWGLGVLDADFSTSGELRWKVRMTYESRTRDDISKRLSGAMQERKERKLAVWPRRRGTGVSAGTRPGQPCSRSVQMVQGMLKKGLLLLYLFFRRRKGLQKGDVHVGVVLLWCGHGGRKRSFCNCGKGFVASKPLRSVC